MSVPMLSVDLIKKLDEDFPPKHVEPVDFRSEEHKAKMLMYAGKRELIESLKIQAEDVQELPTINVGEVQHV